MNIVIASDSFKGSLDSLQAAYYMKKGILRVCADAAIREIAVADGGEGTVSAIVSGLGGKFEQAVVTGPDGKKTEAVYGILPDGTAVIEMAAASGLPLVPAEERNIMKATTYGTGELILEALRKRCKRIYLGVGGSATNDGGIGMAQALGVSFTDRNGNEVGFGGGELERISQIDRSRLDGRITGTEIIVMSDVKNPLCGPQGAAAVYGPQKGADAEQVVILDRGLSHLADLVERDIGVSVRKLPGSGAAGGLGGGLTAFVGAKLQSGIEAILDIAGFEETLNWADLVITGEGRIDSQSVCGKVISGITERAAKYGVPVAAITGCIAGGASLVYQSGLSAMEAAVCRPMAPDEAMGEQAGNMAADAAERLMRAIVLGRRIFCE